MSENSNGFYKSKAFKFINRQYQRISERGAIALRYLKIALEWSLQIAASSVYALVRATGKLKDKLTGKQEDAENRDLSGDRVSFSQEISPTAENQERSQQLTSPSQTKVSLLDFKETLATPTQQTFTKESEVEAKRDNIDESVTEDIDYRELEEFTAELRQELDDYVQKEIERNEKEEPVILEQIEIKAEKGNWIKEVELEAVNQPSWTEETENIGQINWVEEAPKTKEFKELEKDTEEEKENWIREISDRVTEFNREGAEAREKVSEQLEEFTPKAEVKETVNEFPELENIEAELSGLRAESKAKETVNEFAELENIEAELSGLRAESKAKETVNKFPELENIEAEFSEFKPESEVKETVNKFAELEDIGTEFSEFKPELEAKETVNEFAELENIGTEFSEFKRESEVKETKVAFNKSTEEKSSSENIPAKEPENNPSLVFVPRKDRRKIRTKIKQLLEDRLSPKVKRILAKAQSVVGTVITKESLENLTGKAKVTIENIKTAIKTKSTKELATELGEQLKLAAGKAKVFIVSTKEAISDRNKRENAIESTKIIVGDSIEYLLDKTAEYSAKIRNKLDDLEINANVSKFLKTKNDTGDKNLEFKSSVLSGIKNYLDKQKEFSDREQKISPDWIETKATTVGYVKHPLERILSLLDRIMFWIEESIAKVWDWSKDKIEKVRNR